MQTRSKNTAATAANYRTTGKKNLNAKSEKINTVVTLRAEHIGKKCM
jgi:hypothetical protein